MSGAIAGNQASYQSTSRQISVSEKRLELAVWLFITLSSCSFPGWKTLQTTDLCYQNHISMINMIDDKQGLGLTSHVNIEPSTLT